MKQVKTKNKNKKLLTVLIAAICVAAVIAGACAVYFTVFVGRDDPVKPDTENGGSSAGDPPVGEEKNFELQTVGGLDAANASVNVVNYSLSVMPEDTHTVNIRYRFTTDNKLQIILPKRCRIDDRTYEIVVTTTD